MMTGEEFVDNAYKVAFTLALRAIQEAEGRGDYDARNNYVLQAFNLAHLLGHQVGIRVDQKEPDWPCVFIELPTGQISWHLPQHTNEWDGHDTEEKYRRVREFLGEE